MKKNPNVDVIIPTYNGLPWLIKTIDSILAQTYKEIKIYIIDDGSKDKTEDYVGKIKDKRIVYRKKPNGGQATARNLGIDLSDSEFIAFVDADDIWYPTKLEKQMQVISKSKDIGLVYGYHHIINENEEIIGSLMNGQRGDLSKLLFTGNFITGSASMVLMRREVFKNVGKFSEDFLIGEDWDMWLRTSLKYKMDYVPEVIAALRTRGDGMQQDSKKMADGLVHAYEKMKSYARNENERKDLASYCLFHACVSYQHSGYDRKARATVVKLFRENSASIKSIKNWLPYNNGIFLKAIAGSFIFDNILSVPYKIMRKHGRRE